MPISLAVLVVVLAQGSPNFSVEPTVDGLRLMTEGDGVPRELANVKIGPTRDVLRHGTAIYAAPTAGGLVVVDAQDPNAPIITSRLAEGQTIVQFAHQGPATLLAILDNHAALTFDTTDPLHPAPAQYGVEPAPEAGKGRVLAVRDGAMIIEGGTAAGFHLGEHVRIASRAHLSPQDQLARQEGLATVGTTTAVVALDRVEANRSLAHLGRGDDAQPGDEVIGTMDPLSESIFAPQRIPFTWRVDVTLRPFLDTSDNSHGVGLLTDVMVAAYFVGVPLRLEGGIEPLGLATGGNAQHNPSIAVLDLAYATPFFEFGLGTGFSVLAQGNNSYPPASGSEVDPLIVQTLRIGSLDGFNVAWHSAIGSSSNQGFQFRSGQTDVNIPLTSHLTLFVDGGGGSGYGFGDLGVRTYLGGVGGPGTSILSLGLGWAAILDNNEQINGPSILVGYEIRL